MRLGIGARFVAAVTVCLALGGCPGRVAESDLDQYRRMTGETAAARAGENVRCRAQDLVCARIVQMHGEACAQISNAPGLPDDRKTELHGCALRDANALPGLLPGAAPAADQERANVLILDAWRAAIDGLDPAAAPASVETAAAGLAARPGGAPYAATLRAYAAAFAVLHDPSASPSGCPALLDAAATLPQPPPALIAQTVSTLRTAITIAKQKRCS